MPSHPRQLGKLGTPESPMQGDVGVRGGRGGWGWALQVGDSLGTGKWLGDCWGIAPTSWNVSLRNLTSDDFKNPREGLLALRRDKLS